MSSKLMLWLIASFTLFGAYGTVGQAGEGQGAAAAAKRAASVSEPRGAGSELRVRLLSQDQYFNTLSYVFGPDIVPTAHFSPFARTDGLLSDGAASVGVTASQMQQFQRTASTVAQEVVSPERRNFLIPCTPRHEDAADKGCATRFLGSVGRLLWRRPLTPAELAQVVDGADTTADHLKDFYGGLSVALEGMLISPRMVYIIDRSEPDPAHPGQRRLDAYSLASRLSFFLWNAGPDDELLSEAGRGQLQTASGRAKAVDRMLSSSRLETGVRAFFDDMLGYDDFSVLAKDPLIYPKFVGDTVADAREQALRTIVDHLLVRKGDYRDLFTTRHTFLSPSLALLYGVPVPAGWTPYEVPPDSQRVGLLTQIAFLSLHAHPGTSSPTLRGKALRELLLCQRVPHPPPNVDFSAITNPNPNLHTMRERLTAHRSNPVCAGCHRIVDPIGLGLENFDGVGEYRKTEGGSLIDASGTLDGRSFKDAAGLGEAVHDDPALPACLVSRLYSYGVGGPVVNDDQNRSILSYLDARFAQQGYRVPDLLRTIALSEAFSEVSEPPAESTPPTKTATAGGKSSPRVATSTSMHPVK
jgi:hypothetical protein